MTVHRIFITPTLKKDGRHKGSSKGPLFNASYEGQVIVVGSTEPCLYAARILKAKGLTGRLEMWDTVLPYCRFHTDIDKVAGLTVREGDELPRLVKFKSFAPRHAQDGDFSSGGIQVAQTGETRPVDSRPALTGNLAVPQRCPASAPSEELGK